MYTLNGVVSEFRRKYEVKTSAVTVLLTSTEHNNAKTDISALYTGILTMS